MKGTLPALLADFEDYLQGHEAAFGMDDVLGASLHIDESLAEASQGIKSKTNPTKKGIESETHSTSQGIESKVDKAKSPKAHLHPYFHTAFLQMVKHRGKRFRPALTLAVVDALAPALRLNAFTPALALEVMHTYSLIHDDLPCMDDAPLRRGERTLHTIYDAAAATLIGDGLNTYAFSLLASASLPPTTIVALVGELAFSAGVGGMIIGQACDVYFEDRHLALGELEFVHLHKTAALIATSLVFGALIASAKESEIERLRAFGLELGLFFQVRDDYLDATASEAEVGKPVNNDAHKNSYTNLLGIDATRRLLARQKLALTEQFCSFPPRLRANLELLLNKYFKDIDEDNTNK